MVWRTASPRARVATPGPVRCDGGWPGPSPAGSRPSGYARRWRSSPPSPVPTSRRREPVRCVGGDGHHLPDRGQAAASGLVDGDGSSTPRARVATPGPVGSVAATASPAGSRPRRRGPRRDAGAFRLGRGVVGQHLPDRGGYSRCPGAHVATPGRSPGCDPSAITCRIAATRRPVPTSRRRAVPRCSDQRAIACRIAAKQRRCPPMPASRRRGVLSEMGHHLPDRGQAAGAKSVATTCRIAAGRQRCRPRARVATPGRTVGSGASSASTCRIAASRDARLVAMVVVRHRPVPASRRRGVPLRGGCRPAPAGSRPDGCSQAAAREARRQRHLPRAGARNHNVELGCLHNTNGQTSLDRFRAHSE
jgi:hypothetical protein